MKLPAIPAALLFLFFAQSCANPSKPRHKTTDTLTTDKVDSEYVRTGFYFLSDSSDAVKMRKEQSTKIYPIAKTPFASVDHIIKVDVHRTETSDVELCMTFDELGTFDLQNGTGDPAHPKIAVVIANRLIYVVENSAQIKTGIMCTILVDYSRQEIADMVRSINEKR